MHLRTRQPRTAAACSRRMFWNRIFSGGPAGGPDASPGWRRRRGRRALGSLPMSAVVLLRHGESDWNAKGLFTGWVDVGLSATGAAEAQRGGTMLAESGLRPDVVYTSVLTRAIQ